MALHNTSQKIRSTATLVIMAMAAVGYGWTQSRTVSLQLEPRKPKTLLVSLQPNQVALVHLNLQGGILGIRELTPDKNSRPLWLIDLGRGGKLTYVTGSGSGDHTIEITSFEKKRLAEISVEIDGATQSSEVSTNLRDAEDLLANAELIRRHWPSAPVGMDAVDLFDRALAIATQLDDIPLKRLILTQKARYFIFSRNRFADASVLLEQAVAFPSADDAPQQALAWKTLSSARYDLGEYQAAITAGLSALNLYRQTHDLYWQGIVLGNLSSVYSEMGRNADALAAAREALKDAQQEGDTAGVVYCLSQLAGLYQQQGDLEAALRTFHQGLAWVSELGYAPLVEAEIQKDLGSFYTQIGNWEQASFALRRCIELLRGQNDPISLEASSLLASAIQHEGKLKEAVSEDTTAINMARQLELKQQEANVLLKRSAIYLALHNQRLAESDIAAASTLASQLESLPLQVETAIALGDAQLEKDAGTAATSYQKALQLADQAGEREERSLALAGLARAQERQGQLEDAVASIEAALKIVETSRRSLASRELQASYFSLHRNWYELAVDICMELDHRYPEKDYSKLAFAYTERARSRSLLDTLDSSGYADTMPVPENLRVAYALNQRDVVAQQAALANSTGSHTAEIAGKLQQLYQKQEDLESQMRSSDSQFGRLLPSHTITAEQVQQQLLERNSALLAYWIGETHSYRWIFTPDHIQIDILPARSELEQTILPLEAMLRNRRPRPVPGKDVSSYLSRQSAYDARLQLELTRSGSMLFSNVPNDVHTIFVVSDGCLQALPFAALRIHDRKMSSYALRRYKIFLEPSASVGLYLKQHPASDRVRHITIFADPVFSLSDHRFDRVIQPKQTNNSLLFANMQRLTGSAEEARAISHHANGKTVILRTGFDASPEAVRNLPLDSASILHFATHTVTVPGHPEVTGIVLSMLDHNGKEQNGVFWLKDIYALHLPLSLVVLSACNTDKRNSDTGESLNSLSYAFFFSGAHSVVGSLWTADDNATAQLMDMFYYELLTKQKGADEALRDAQLKLLADPKTSSPAVWASFVLEGWPAVYSVKQDIAEGSSASIR